MIPDALRYLKCLGHTRNNFLITKQLGTLFWEAIYLASVSSLILTAFPTAFFHFQVLQPPVNKLRKRAYKTLVNLFISHHGIKIAYCIDMDLFTSDWLLHIFILFRVHIHCCIVYLWYKCTVKRIQKCMDQCCTSICLCASDFTHRHTEDFLLIDSLKIWKNRIMACSLASVISP